MRTPAHARVHRARPKALVLAAVLPAALLTPLASTGASAGATLQQLDVAAPEAGITDVLATVAPRRLDCGPDQVDVNTATPGALETGLGIPSGPTLDRVIALRPWLKPTDLISVPGVPLEIEPRLSERGCATPTRLPMATPRACSSGSKAVDVQSAGVDEISRTLGVPRSTAQALVAARPLPQDLVQVIAPRVPGLSEPTLETLTKQGKLCVTPAPVEYSGTTWRWVAAERGAVVAAASDARYALIVPPNRVQSASGIWGSVTPDLSAALPTADFHLHGDWTPEVAGRLPDVSAGDAGVIHELGNGEFALSWGEGVSTSSNGTVTNALRSLSETSSFDRGPFCREGAHADVALMFCTPTARDTPFQQIVKGQAEEVAQYIARIPDRGPCVNTDRVVSRGNLLFGMVCHPQDFDTYGEWRVGNYTAGEVWGTFSSFGAVFRRTPIQATGSTITRTWVDDSKYELLGRHFARALAADGTMLADTEATVRKTAGTGESTYTFEAVGEPELAALWALFNVLKTADVALEIAEIETWSLTGAAECIKDGVVKLESVKTAISCVKAGVDATLHGEAIEARRSGDMKRVEKLDNARKVLGKLSMATSFLPDVIASFGFHLGSRAEMKNDVVLQYLSPAAGTGGGTNRPGVSQYNWDIDGIADDGTFIARTTETTSSGVRRSYLVNSRTGIAQEIDDGGDFLCYAKKRLVFDFVEAYADNAGTKFLNVYPRAEVQGDAAPCTWVPPEIMWTFDAPPDGNTPHNVILHGESVDGRPTRSALINNEGVLQEIPDGGVYVCLAAQSSPVNPVIWNVPDSAFENWRVKGPQAECG